MDEVLMDGPVEKLTQVEPEVAWLDAQQLDAWKQLMGLIMTLPVALDTQLKRDAGLNLFEYHVLASLSAAPQATLLMSDLAEQSLGSLSRLSHAVSRLERAGWVERRSCGGAGRRTEARLTEKGRQLLRRTAPGHVREARRLVIDALTCDALQALGEAAGQVVAATGLFSAELMGRNRSGDR
jgi:DNA-binding MarR family transcriptional regulator